MFQNHLPPEFHLLLGRYVAACAHIERQAWRIIWYAKGLEPDTPENANEIIQLRKNGTSAMMSNFKKAAESIQTVERGELLKIADHIQNTHENRHIAVHGAWFYDNGRFRVEYFRNTGDRKHPAWAPIDETFSLDDLRIAVEDAERTVSRLKAIEPRLG